MIAPPNRITLNSTGLCFSQNAIHSAFNVLGKALAGEGALLQTQLSAIADAAVHNVDFNQPSPYLGGAPPLHYAAEKGLPHEILKALLKGGADPLKKDGNGNTPLHLAAAHDQLLSAFLLLEAGADSHAKNSEGKFPEGSKRMNGLLEIYKKGKERKQESIDAWLSTNIAVLEHRLKKETRLSELALEQPQEKAFLPFDVIKIKIEWQIGQLVAIKNACATAKL